MKVLDAFQLAARLHEGQFDKAGRPYIEHLVRVLLRVQELAGGRDQQIAALLHDAIEDQRATATELLEAGVPEDAIDLIQVLTRKRGERYLQHVERVKAEPRAGLVKACDLADNSDPRRLALLHEQEARRLLLKYQQAFDVLGE
jgi:(p)ppGpp synthase/HD superfamily hydrolase